MAKYSQGAGIDEPLSELRSSAVSYYEQDGIGSVTSLSNIAGSLANTYVYDSFGSLTSSTGSVTNPYQYTGRDYDPETGLRYYRARYYDPAAGRFISEDPIGFDGGENFYAHVQNHPTDLVDPFGLAMCIYSVQAHMMVCYKDQDFMNWLKNGEKGSPANPVQLGPEGVNSGADKDGQQCKNNNKCTNVRDLGPITPGFYRMNLDTRPEHAGWGLYRLEPWPHSILDGWLYKHHFTRGGFELHLGSITYGCINADKTNPKAAEQYGHIRSLLQSEDGGNFLTVVP